MITYRTGNDLNLDEVIAVYAACSLGGRRPIADRERMEAMVRGSNLLITAWEGDLMVGISRSVSDYSYATYLSDLAVRDSHQRMGIGKELIRLTQQAAPQAMVILLSAPQAVAYYPHIGMESHSSAWILRPGQTIP